jgi:hypothetical protein
MGDVKIKAVAGNKLAAGQPAKLVLCLFLQVKENRFGPNGVLVTDFNYLQIFRYAQC